MQTSLEFAHTNLTEVARGETQRSVEAASAVLRYLRAQGHEVSTVVLLEGYRPLDERSLIYRYQ